jgi:hypothetical protein
MALKQLGAEAGFKRVYMADDGGMMDAQNFGSTGNGAHTGDLKGGADFIPVFHVAAPACVYAQKAMIGRCVQGRTLLTSGCQEACG